MNALIMLAFPPAWTARWPGRECRPGGAVAAPLAVLAILHEVQPHKTLRGPTVWAVRVVWAAGRLSSGSSQNGSVAFAR
jgi:hypothetical protein